MSRSLSQMPNFGFAGLKELRKRLSFSLLALIVYRIGAHIRLPGLDPERISLLFNQAGGELMARFNMLSGGSFFQCTIFAIGLSPYISASIFIKLLSVIVPSIEQLKKEGGLGRRKLNQYTRYITIGLATIGSISTIRLLMFWGVVVDPDLLFYVTTTLTLVAGSAFLMWLSEQITQRGIGNGSSIIIFAGVVSSIPRSTIQLIEQLRQGQIAWLTVFLLILIISSVTGFVVYMERAQRKITINYPKRQQGRHIYAAQSSHLPLKINMGGIMPTIFSSTIMMVVTLLLGWLGLAEKYVVLKTIASHFSPGQPLYMLASALAIIFFCFFYIAIDPDFNPREVADNLKKSGAFISGIRPGEQSAQYIDNIMTRLTAIACLYLVLVVLLPDLIVISFGIPFAFGGVALLIVVGVVMEIIAKIQSLLMSQQYESLLKKAGLKGNIPIR